MRPESDKRDLPDLLERACSCTVTLTMRASLIVDTHSLTIHLGHMPYPSNPGCFVWPTLHHNRQFLHISCFRILKKGWTRRFTSGQAVILIVLPRRCSRQKVDSLCSRRQNAKPKCTHNALRELTSIIYRQGCLRLLCTPFPSRIQKSARKSNAPIIASLLQA